MQQLNCLWTALLLGVALLGQSLSGYASDIVEVIPLTNRIIMVHFDDGYVRHHQKGEARTNEWVIQDPLNIELATQLGSYTISSSDDSNFSGGVLPTDIGRKSKGTDFTWLCQSYNDSVGCINTDADHAKEHWIYLYLDNPMLPGNTYTISTGELAANGNSYELLYDPKLASSRSEAVHVNMIGYAPSAPKKYGYVYHWMGEKGGLDLSPYAGATFWLVNTSDNSVAYSGTIAFRKAADNVETGQPDDTPDDNFLGAEVYEADFSNFATPGEYRLAVEGIGSSFPFVIDDNAYFEPFYNIVRGLYHQRSGIELESAYTRYVRPAPHNPNITPGFAGKLQYTTSRFIDWENQDNSDKDKPAIEAGILGPLDTYGWYQDAGDWDSYFSHFRVPALLLFLYEFAPAKFPDSQLNIPESGNGVPDLVDEAAWLPRFFHRTRQELIAKGYGTGGVGSRVAGDWFGGDGEGVPSYEDVSRTWIVSGEDPFSTYKYAATAAHLAIALQKAGVTDPEGVDWQQEATEAYAWAKANTHEGDEEPVFNLRLSDQRLYAAAALYKLTGEEMYHDQVKADAADINSGTVLGDDQRWGVYTYLTMGPNRPVDPALYAALRDATLNSADNVLTDVVERRATRYGGNFFFPMLVGQPTTPMIFDGLMGFMLTKDSNAGRANNYLANIYTTSDYFLGTNPLNTVWATGLGERHPNEVFHLDSWYNGLDTQADEVQTEFYPGLVPYGPWINDGSAFGPWDNDWAGKTTFPEYETWPGHERWYDQRTAPLTAEFTIHQNAAPAAVTYGFLIDGPFGDFSTGTETVTAVELSPDSLTIGLNEASQLTLTTTPANAGGGLVWNTQDPSIATIDRNGIVTGVGLGTTQVSVANADGSISDSVLVEVVARQGGITYVVANFDEVVPTNNVVEPDKTQMFAAGGTFAFVANPDPDTNNESAQVARFDRDEGTYKLVGFNLPEALPARLFNTLSFQLYGTNISQVFVVVSNGEGVNLVETQQSVTIADSTWGTVEITIPNAAEGSIKDILIFPNPTDGAEATFYVDNVQLLGDTPAAPVSGVELSEDSVNVGVGETLVLQATVLPATALERGLTWRSSDESVATVDSSGTVSGVSEGVAAVTVTTIEGQFTDSVYVTVTPGSPTRSLIVADFDEVIPTNGVIEPGRTQMFAAGGTAAIVSNPVPTAANSSDQVAQFDKAEGTYKLIGFNLPEATPIDQFQTFSFQLYGTNVTQVYVSLGDGNGTTVTESFQEVNIDQEWGTVTLNIPADVSTSVKTILIFPDPNNADSATFYVDNVRFDGKGEPVAPEVTIVVSPETITLESGAIATLTAEVTPAEADVSLQWSTSDAIVAEVDSSGQVTALTAGSATIVATTADGTAADSATVIVIPNTLKGDLIVADFDEVIPTVGIVEPGRTQSFGAGGEIAIVANPKSSPANPSEQVLQFDKGEGTYKLIGFNLQVGRSLNRYETFSFQVYGSSNVSEVLIVLNDPTGKTTLSMMPTVAIDSGTWGTVTVDILEGTIGSVKDILIFPNPTEGAAAVYYFDNVRFNSEPVVATYQVGDCTLIPEDFPSDLAEVVAVSEVSYADFSTNRGTYVIGVVTGIRADGRAGAWEVHNDCSIQPLRKSGLAHRTSLLPDVRGVERCRGWRYKPTGISEDGKFIYAQAINENGFTHRRGWSVAPGTVVDVEFALGGPFYGRIFGAQGSILCDDLVVETFAGNYFVVRCDDVENGRAASSSKEILLEESIGQVSLYPNPTTGEVVVEGLKDAFITAITVMDAQGRVVSKLNRSSLLNSKGTVDLSAYADGIYTLKVTSAERTSVHRVVVRK